MEGCNVTTLGVIICGSRNFYDYCELERVCDEVLLRLPNTIITIIEGEASGADKLGRQYAESRGFKVEPHPADWSRLGKKAGSVRNREMAQSALEKYDKCMIIAFNLNNSRGTNDMVNVGMSNNIPVIVKRYRKE